MCEEIQVPAFCPQNSVVLGLLSTIYSSWHDFLISPVIGDQIRSKQPELKWMCSLSTLPNSLSCEEPLPLLIHPLRACASMLQCSRVELKVWQRCYVTLSFDLLSRAGMSGSFKSYLEFRSLKSKFHTHFLFACYVPYPLHLHLVKRNC
jgi:hypothetical protein